MISVLVLTKNEEQDLPGCLESVRWSDDVHVYDSFSNDRTVEIARDFGAKITQRRFDNWSAHQNWGLKNIKFKHSWVFHIDADERATPELICSIRKNAENPLGHVAFRIRRRDFFMGKWLKHVQASPYYLRLFCHENMRYERLINPISIPGGTVGDARGYLDHYPFSKGITLWFERHNNYSTLEAMQILEDRRSKQKLDLFKAIFAKDFHERRYHQKELFYRLPARPVFKFFMLYVLKMGFLDGYAGFTYAILQSIYEYFILLKVYSLSRGLGRDDAQ